MINVTFLFHSGILIEMDSKRFLIDPFTGKSINNFEVKNDFDYSKLKRIDYVFISQEHSSHCDTAFVNRLIEKQNSKAIGTGKVKLSLACSDKNFIQVSVGDEFDIGNVRVKVVRALHPQSANPVGYIFSYSGKKIYFTGDTYKFSDAYKYQCDLLIVPIGGTYTMDAYDAGIFSKDVRAKYVIPVHYGSYPRIAQDITEFIDYLESVGITPIVLKSGQKAVIK